MTSKRLQALAVCKLKGCKYDPASNPKHPTCVRCGRPISFRDRIEVK